MGIGYVASAHNYYEGRLTLAGEAPISPGTLVSADYAAGTAKIGVEAISLYSSSLRKSTNQSNMGSMMLIRRSK